MITDLDAYPLTPVQQGLLFHLLIDGASGAYVQQLVLDLDGLASPAALRAAWQDAVDRQPVLRTGFYWAGLDEPLQVVAARARPEWTSHDWSREPAAGQEELLTALLEEDRRRGFVPDEPPLLRLALLRRGADRYWLLISHHHLILDGWSVSLLLGEVLRGYRGRLNGELAQQPAPAPSVTTSPGCARRIPGPRARTGATPWPGSPVPRPCRDCAHPGREPLPCAARCS
jgi:hypothetical protein